MELGFFFLRLKREKIIDKKFFFLLLMRITYMLIN